MNDARKYEAMRRRGSFRSVFDRSGDYVGTVDFDPAADPPPVPEFSPVPNKRSVPDFPDETPGWWGCVDEWHEAAQ